MFDQDQALLDFMTFRTHEAMIFDLGAAAVVSPWITFTKIISVPHSTQCITRTHSPVSGFNPTDHASRNLPRRTQPWVCLATEMQPDENLVRVLRFQHSWIRVPRETRGPGVAGGPA